MAKKKIVTVIGGGTGTFVVLSGLKQYDLDLGVIVSMMDSGGSTGKLRDQLGVLPPGDLRQCLVALSEASMLWRKLFLYRFESGDIQGHNFGNIFLSALEKVTSNYQNVVDSASYILKTKGCVIPVTFTKTQLCARYNNGKILTGEEAIDNNTDTRFRIQQAFLEPQVKAYAKALKRLKKSQYLIIGPGDLYTSIIPVLLVGGIKETIAASKAKIIFVMNLMTKAGQTTNYSVQDHLHDLERYLGRKVDIIIYNNSPIADEILNWYSKNQEEPVLLEKQAPLTTQLIIKSIADKTAYQPNVNDKLKRSILRHNPKKLAHIISKIIYA